MVVGLSLMQKATRRARKTGNAPIRNGMPRNSRFSCGERMREAKRRERWRKRSEG